MFLSYAPCLKTGNNFLSVFLTDFSYFPLKKKFGTRIILEKLNEIVNSN